MFLEDEKYSDNLPDPRESEAISKLFSTLRRHRPYHNDRHSIYVTQGCARALRASLVNCELRCPLATSRSWRCPQ